MTKTYVRTIPAAEFERMKIIAQAAGVKLETDSQVFTICFLADTFRGISKIDPYRRDEEVRAKCVAHKRKQRAL